MEQKFHSFSHIISLKNNNKKWIANNSWNYSIENNMPSALTYVFYLTLCFLFYLDKATLCLKSLTSYSLPEILSAIGDISITICKNDYNITRGKKKAELLNSLKHIL